MRQRLATKFVLATCLLALLGVVPAPASAAGRPVGPLSLSTGSYFGAYGNPVSNDGINGGQAEISGLEADIGRKLDIDNRFYTWAQQLPTAQEVWDVQNGRIPMVTWGKHDTLDIISGSQDAWIRAQADRLATLGGSFFLRFFAEPDGAYQANIVHAASDYIAAWRHVHDIFVEEGATNAIWVWCPTANSFKPGSTNPWPPTLYPGDAYVDWVAADGYNWYPSVPTNGGRTFKQVFQDFYDWAVTSGKPIMIAETAALADNPDQAAWLTAAANTVETDMTMIQAFVYFDTLVQKSGNTYDWRVSTVPATYDAYKAMAADPYFNPLSGPDTQAPTVPGKPSGTSTTPGQIDLMWAASSDDLATTIAYRLFRDGGSIPVGTVLSSSTTTVGFTDTGLAQGSSHTYQVDASDGTNTSALSPSSDPITVASGPPTVFSDSFSSGFGAWSPVTNLTLDNTTGGASPPSAKAQPAGVRAFARTTLPQTYPSLCMSEAINLSSLGTSSVALLKLRAGGVSLARILVAPNRALKVRNDVTGATFLTGRTLTVGWHSIELCVTVGASGSLSMSYDGTPAGSWSAQNLGTTPISGLQILDDTAKTFTANVDDVAAHE